MVLEQISPNAHYPGSIGEDRWMVSNLIYVNLDRAIVSDPTVRSGPNLQDECPIPCRTHRNFRIRIWRSWAPWARFDQGLAWHRLSGVETGPISGVGCTGYLALRQAPYVALVVPAYGEIM
ncbi:hypothetical protein Prudu_018959 [Prunus dulcis]|uniref:Uncharacterized protein n=1 Tax=Prunus dulcis TaxID=3755 RepID=A0A4Y1RS20_PRUDU|nr:hypothetical protein Prudu_018959 [Prunus dulcis]